ncbi:hypothetical protein [Dyadobacter sp. LHD-138]|uniref:hypothetical protein n=1 Tax=Dyadobacter sp. LHD-138 TaxID=3071413 RepID=UPI0027E0CFE4|nr:hypothetical protein [Dyadobacter sp. LHD-138]MDQ6481669.1 hypothetical protein [Dyadobacter sp. LHD-138]
MVKDCSRASLYTYLLVSLMRKIHRSTRGNDNIQFKESKADDYHFMVTFSIQDQWLQSETEAAATFATEPCY